MLTRKLFRTAWQYKSQFISMIIMICLGIGVFLGFNIEWKSIDDSTSEFFEQTNYADFRIYSDSGFTVDDVKKIQDIDGVDAATRYLSVNVGIKDAEKTLTLNVSENYEVSTMVVTSGDEYDETYIVSILLTFAVSMLVGLMVAAKNKKIDMVEALKCSE